MSVEPRQAASLILLRESAGGAEVLLVQRNPEQRFMGGAWVFPGGAVQDGEDADHAAAAVRELEEEAGIGARGGRRARAVLALDHTGGRGRDDPLRHLVLRGEGTGRRGGAARRRRVRRLALAHAGGALDAHARDELALVFPTIKHLELLSETPSVDATLATARERPVEPVLPKVAVRDGSPHVLLPGDPGYDEA